MKNDLPQFSQIDPKNIESGLNQLLKNNRTTIEKRLSEGAPFNWDNFIHLIENLDDKFHQYWAPISHLNAVANTPELRDAYNSCIPKISEYFTVLSHNRDYYEAIKYIAESKDYEILDFAQKKVIEHDLRDFKLSGVTLTPEKKEAFAELSKKLSQLSTKFEENVLDATQGWTKLITDEKELAGLPEFAIQAAAEAAQKKSEQQDQKAWLFTLEIPSYSAVITYADSRDLRKEMYVAYVTRASDEGPTAGQWDNSNIIIEILDARLAMANLLDFNNYAEYSLATKMVHDTKEVLSFLGQLVQASLEKAKKEYEELKAFSKKELNLDDLFPWDIAYASEKQKQAEYHISQEDVRPYFPEYKVLDGLFKIAGILFNISVRPIEDADLWHPDAKCYGVYQGGELISYFYLDLYARKNKRGGAWMDDSSVRRKLADGSYQPPVAFIVCNFNPPLGQDPALFTHDEVLTLFHEFGHSLQLMLSKIDYVNVSGLNGIPWDAVEIVSQFMENYAWEKESLAMISEHYKTKEPLPKDLFEKMCKAKNFQSGLHMIRQLEFSLLDFHLHMEFDPKEKNHVQKIIEDVRSRTSVIPALKFNRVQNGFSHIFAGGYAAGYYSYKWAEVMAHDAFSLFKEKGLFDKATSEKFLHTFLEMGGSKEPMDLFVEFRGRKPQVEALLKDSGIKEYK